MDETDSGNQLHTCGECGAGYKWKKYLVRHIRSKHEGVRYSCPYTKLLNIHVTSVSMRQHNRDILKNTKNPYTKVLDITATNVSIRQQHRDILRDTNSPYTKMLNIYVTSVGIRQCNREILRDINKENILFSIKTLTVLVIMLS
jgi:hypothetical protein